MTIRKLSALPYGNAHVEIDNNGNIYLYSYTTNVAIIDANGWVFVRGLYSRTTRKHLGAFAREYITFPNGTRGDYYFLKACYEGQYEFNIQTGEIRAY